MWSRFFGTQCSAAGTRRRLLNSTVVTMDDETAQMKQLPDNEFNNTQTTESTQTDRQTDRPALQLGLLWHSEKWRIKATEMMMSTAVVTLDEQMLIVTLLTCVTPVTQ